MSRSRPDDPENDGLESGDPDDDALESGDPDDPDGDVGLPEGGLPDDLDDADPDDNYSDDDDAPDVDDVLSPDDREVPGNPRAHVSETVQLKTGTKCKSPEPPIEYWLQA